MLKCYTECWFGHELFKVGSSCSWEKSLDNHGTGFYDNILDFNRSFRTCYFLAASRLLDAVVNDMLCIGHVLACRKWLQTPYLAGFRGRLADDMYVCSHWTSMPQLHHILSCLRAVYSSSTIAEVFDINCPAIVGISKLMRIICQFWINTTWTSPTNTLPKTTFFWC
jgi:hypothetical protein